MSKKLTIVLLKIEGALARLTTILADADINITDMDAAELDDIGVAHVTVADADFEKTHELLRDSGHQVMPQQVLLVKIEDKPGGLAQLAVKLADAHVNVRSMRIVRREDGYCLAALVAEPSDVAKSVLVNELVA